ncbi:class I SAM-dependent methyltransferase [Sansalvadorimonas verongulae]|uniref:class I SAM-dependent methyltransferase n=1 Tax=Sansalvadorimonas verongulae TaxID=2172824 RepID=UPI0012BC9DC5|nr:class I SAM-dependent methyltransferase [Sansalvadorimonas verongulae]MTI13423.1 class I SAM-dependent methyltransferase [Sansalvadorimonas verongulae]
MKSTAQQDTTPYKPVSHTGGVTFDGTNVLVDDWIQCWDGSHPLLDIGCGNCNNAMKALESHARVCATEITIDTIHSLIAQFSLHPKLSFHHLVLPEFVPFDDSTFSGILCSEVFHFLNHAEVVATVWELHRLLISGGKAAITCSCEDLKIFQNTGLKELRAQQRIQRPDYLTPIDDMLGFERKLMEMEPPTQDMLDMYELHKKTMPKPYFNAYNPEQLGMLFERMGFEIELLTTGPAPHYPIWEHGEDDQVRLIARKK